jgi:excisionase family DNA binding protein
VTSTLASALLDALDDDALDFLADRLAPRLADRLDRAAPDDGYLDSTAAAEFLGSSRGRIHDLVQLGRLQPLRDGRSLRLRRADLRAYLESSA